MSSDHLKKWKDNGCLIAFAFIDWDRLGKAWLCREVYFNYYLTKNKTIVVSLDGDKFNAHLVLNPFEKQFKPDEDILNLFEYYHSFIVPILENSKDQTLDIELEEKLFKDWF
jgi:hypothetical protein